MTDPTPPTPLELARVNLVAWRRFGAGDRSLVEAEIQRLALTSPQHRAGIRREAFREIAEMVEAIPTGFAFSREAVAAAIIALGETPDDNEAHRAASPRSIWCAREDAIEQAQGVLDRLATSPTPEPKERQPFKAPDHYPTERILDYIERVVLAFETWANQKDPL